MKSSTRFSSVASCPPIAFFILLAIGTNTNANGETGTITPIAEWLEDAFPDLGNDPTKFGEWESFGIVQVGNLGLNTPWMVFDVQAHTDLRQNVRFSEGGQLLLRQQTTETVSEPATAAGLAVFGSSALALRRKRTEK